MSKTTAVAIVMAMVLILAAVNAQATNNGISEAQIRALIKKEVAKIPRVRGPAGPRGAQGPAGPAGPPGMDGLPSLFARVSFNGFVDPSRSSGISEENFEVHEGEIGPPEARVRNNHYCFVGLPPVTGGQVTLDGFSFPVNLAAPTIEVGTEDPECPIRVSVPGIESLGIDRENANFYILLY